jgi:hypothetical protein
MLGPAPVALFVVSQVPSFAGLDELTAAGARATDGAGGYAARPLVTQLAVIRSVAAFDGAATFDVALPLVFGPAGVAAPNCVACEVGAACIADAEAGGVPWV